MFEKVLERYPLQRVNNDKFQVNKLILHQYFCLSGLRM